MKILYLNETLTTALRSANVEPGDIVKAEVRARYLVDVDIGTIDRETTVLASHPLFQRLGLRSFFGDEGYSSSVDTNTSLDVPQLLPHLKAVPGGENTVVLYADSQSPEIQDVVENIFNALALIMPINTVLESGIMNAYIQM